MWFRKFLVPYKQVIKFIFPNAAFVVKSMSETLTNAMYLNETEICFFATFLTVFSHILKYSLDLLVSMLKSVQTTITLCFVWVVQGSYLQETVNSFVM